MDMNSKAQSSITDALYFLLIVSGVCILLFVFSSNYGNTVNAQIDREFGSEYASSAFKALLYSSTPRIAGENLETTNETDYLLAAVKEDFADDKEINKTKDVIANNIVGIMEPLQDTYDYLFYIYASQTPPYVTEGFVYLLFSAKIPAQCGDGVCTVGDCSADCVGKTPQPRQHRIFLCPNTPKINDLELMLTKLGSVSQSVSYMRLPFVDPADNSVKLADADAGFAMWVSRGTAKDTPLAGGGAPQEYLKILGCVPCWQRDPAGDWKQVTNASGTMDPICLNS